MSIQIIDVIDCSGDVKADTEELNKLEDYYMRMLNTIHPLGLNDKVASVGCVSKSHDSPNVFYNTPIKRRKRSHGVRHRSNFERQNPISVDDIRSQLRELYDSHKFADFYKLLRTLYHRTL